MIATPVMAGPALTIAWLLLPYLAAFVAALLPGAARSLSLLCCLATGAIATAISLGLMPDQLELLGSWGVLLRLPATVSPFLWLAALVHAAVLLDGWRRPQDTSQVLLLSVLHGGLAFSFVAADLISLYVALEVVGISAFLLILLPRTARALWIALRYLLVSNSVMTLYLIGAAIVYSQAGSFRYTALAQTDGAAAAALLLLGLFTKAGLFVSGLWLPRTHAEAPPEVSALLSGVVVTAGVAPLMQLTSLTPSLLPTVRAVGLASALLGVVYALVDHDAKRLLAWSTLSQMGLVVLSPLGGGVMALAHGLAKAALFLTARSFPSRRLEGWTGRPLAAAQWWPLWLASLSIAGLPALLGAAAKARLELELPQAWVWGVSLASVGTVAVYARLWGAPLAAAPASGTTHPPSGWSAGTLLLLVPLVGGGLLTPWSWMVLAKAALILLAGLAVHHLLEPLRRRPPGRLPPMEQLPDLLGGMGLVGAGLLGALSR
ncbi:MAG: proton-conducting transporter membrane subunit [Cyanobacteriota bacterium]|nr:proton-conducting transporter membrane subunit [Cyanobacteriota bacterium]